MMYLYHFSYTIRNGSLVFVFEDNGEKRRDVSTIKDGDIYSNDLWPFMYCKDCTAEIDGRKI